MQTLKLFDLAGKTAVVTVAIQAYVWVGNSISRSKGQIIVGAIYC
jgi:hypothetical protein